MRDFSCKIFRNKATILVGTVSEFAAASKNFDIQVDINSINTGNSMAFIYRIFILLTNILCTSKIFREHFQDWFMKFTFDSIFKVGFEIDLGSLEGSTKGTTFVKVFDDECKHITAT